MYFYSNIVYFCLSNTDLSLIAPCQSIIRVLFCHSNRPRCKLWRCQSNEDDSRPEQHSRRRHHHIYGCEALHGRSVCRFHMNVGAMPVATTHITSIYMEEAFVGFISTLKQCLCTLIDLKRYMPASYRF